MSKVSIIIPVYNVEKYLKKCLDSVLSQSLIEIEIICVNDGSTDKSGDILDEFAIKDSRVHIVHKKNAGYGAAINDGIALATGEYIGIVESDDYILPNMYRVLYEQAKADDLDLIKSEAYYWYEKYNYLERIHRPGQEEYFDRVLMAEDREHFFPFYMNIWTGLYKRQFLQENNIRCNTSPGASFQDNGFWIQTMLLCKKAKWINGAFYYYRHDNPDSSIKSKEKVYAMTREYEWVLEKIKLLHSEYAVEICTYYKLFRNQGNFYRIDDKYKSEFCNQIKLDYDKYGSVLKRNVSLKEWYEKVLHNSKEYCNNFIQCKKEIEKKLDNSKYIFLYGCGNFGKTTFKYIERLGYYENMFFLETKPNDREFMGKKIKEPEIIEGENSSVVIIAASHNNGNYQQIESIVRDINRDISVIDYKQVLEYFYFV